MQCLYQWKWWYLGLPKNAVASGDNIHNQRRSLSYLEMFWLHDRKRILPAQKQPEQKTTVRATTALSTRHRVKLRRHETIHVATKKILSNNGMLWSLDFHSFSIEIDAELASIRYYLPKQDNHESNLLIIYFHRITIYHEYRARWHQNRSKSASRYFSGWKSREYRW